MDDPNGPATTTMAPTDQALIRPDGPALPARRPAAALTTRQSTMATAFQGLIPTSIGEVQTLATALARSEVIPKALRQRPDDVFVVIMTGLELGLSPLQAVNNISIISGNLSLKANLQLAIVRQSGLLAYWDEGFDDTAKNADDWFGWAEVSRQGIVDPDDPKKLKVFRREFGVRHAKRVRTYENNRDITLDQKSNYQNWPDRMYPYRARSWVLEAVFGDVLKGLPATEGLVDGQVIDAEFQVEPAERHDDIDALMAAIHDQDADLAVGIDAGFDALKLSPARRLQKLVEFKGRPKDLLTWLRDEYGQREGKGKAGTARRAKEAGAVLDGQAPTTPATAPESPQATTAPAADPNHQAPADVTPATTPAPAADPPGPTPAAKLKSFRDAFKSGSTF